MNDKDIVKYAGDGMFLNIPDPPHHCKLPQDYINYRGDYRFYRGAPGTEWLCNSCARVWLLNDDHEWEKQPTALEIAQQKQQQAMALRETRITFAMDMAMMFIGVLWLPIIHHSLSFEPHRWKRHRGRTMDISHRWTAAGWFSFVMAIVNVCVIISIIAT